MKLDFLTMGVVSLK